MNQLRILHVVGGMNRGGAETFIMNLYRNINRNKVQFDFAVNTSSKCHYDDEIVMLGGRIYRHPDPRTTGLWGYQKAFLSTLRNNGPFAGVHSHVFYFSAFIHTIAKQVGIPLRIAHSHSTITANTVSRHVYWNIAKTLLNRYATHFWGCSPEACERLYGRNCWTDKRTRVIKNAVDLSKFQKAYSPRLRTLLKISEDEPIITHIGRFVLEKNHHHLIRLVQELLKTKPMHLILVGDGPMRKEVEDLVCSYGLTNYVHFLGIRDDISDILAGSDLFILPSHREGLPVTLVEAQATGLPCIISSAITKQADLNLGLLKYVNLDSPLSTWAREVIINLNIPRLDNETCKRGLSAAGYCIREVVNQIENVYVEWGSQMHSKKSYGPAFRFNSF